MKDLPQFVRRFPYIFYFLALVTGIWRYTNDWLTVSESMQYATDLGPMKTIARSTALYWGVVEAAYMAASGAMIHVLIAIYDKVRSE
ncbi:MAG: hypothetical protein Pars92KO_14080 [Parasphingorhabdus sp.]